MPALLLYLLKVNAALALFYVAYHFILRRLTFYHLNRLFLVFSIMFSTLYPFIDFTGLLNRHQALANAYTVTVPAWVSATVIPDQGPVFDYWQIPVFLFWIGAMVMAFRLLIQFISLFQIHSSSVPARHKGVSFRKIESITQAFSFWQTIYLNPEQHKHDETESILRHEQVHIQGWHTLDVLLAELSTVFYWFNPGVWLLKKAIKENLEFIADQKVVKAGADRKQYQYLLLKVTATPEPQIANQFNFPSLKRRIAMMNKKQSSLLQVARYAVLVPLMMVPALIVTACSEEPDVSLPDAVAVQEQASAKATIPDSVIYYIDGKEVPNDAIKELDPNEISSISVLKGESAKKAFGDKAAKGMIVITTKKNKDSPQVLKFNEALPVPPPPAPEPAPVPPPPPATEADAAPSHSKQQQNEAFIFTPNEVDYYRDETKLPEDYKAFLKRNPTVKQVGWKFNNRKDYNLESIVIYLKSGKSEVYDFNGSKSIPAAESKYGQLPGLLPPPPPVRVKK
ncbi:hypothetical protein I2I11_08520 [Pontibacter sp. 172403-2]|uniref:M56 family metallopeptidase n=1 Tax=Pontibacter rufus TaxID=2791028 RepID=UPI0018AF93BB|nr:M56 family metallopeptidase [Pontibacter sp. 172403-2]MBF9253333.1 hypothetical protein [Pontibacter sp. 172403-2]